MEPNEPKDQDWQAALRQAEVLRRLPPRPSAAEIADAMADLSVSRATLFRRLRRFRGEGRASALVVGKAGRRLGVDPLDPELKSIVDQNIATFYATAEKPSLTQLRRRIATDCRPRLLNPPSIRRLKAYLGTLDAEALTRKREGKARADARFLALPGGLSVERAMQIVQIDHSKVDVTVVDPIERLPIGRPILTVAIDVFTRMVLGFYLSLEAPSVTSVALCLTYAVMDKTAWLAERGVTEPWPASGLPECIHVDNGAEFHARAFKRGCADHGVAIAYRPPGTPRFGGHIERLIGTMMGAVHLLPGTHFSNVAEKGDYDPESRAVMTMRELETFLALEIVGSYHAGLHRSLDRPPIAAWREAALTRPSRLPVDALRFLLDLLPFEASVLRRTGVHMHNICYWSDGFAPWIGRHDDKVIVKYDPRDLRQVYVRLGESYLAAPTRNLTRPAISLWEQRAALRVQHARGRREVDEDLIFRTIAAQRALVDNAAREAAELRKARARRAHLSPPPAHPPPESVPGDEKPLALPYFPIEVWK